MKKMTGCLGVVVAVAVALAFAAPSMAKSAKYSKPAQGASEEGASAAPAAMPAPTAAAMGARQSIHVAVYPVKTDGFTLNDSEVIEISRIALQACYDAGFKCSGRGETVENVQREQGYEGRGRVTQARYVAEFTLVGRTKDKFKLGIPGDIPIGGGYGADIGGAVVGGGGIITNLSGFGLSASQMALAGQFSDTQDAVLVYSNKLNKLNLQGSFIIGAVKSSNSDKLSKAFKVMFDGFAQRMGQ
jgi:hypothetical protein